jgi:hypothetical protein
MRPPKNQCSACGEEFSGVQAFDAHRIGKYPQRGSAEYRDRVACDLIPPEKPWRPTSGRRCLDITELEPRGFVRNAFGAWTLAESLLRARERFSDNPHKREAA